ncbi:hypothetical protein OAV92_03440 [Crocinitomicaceae bacterium]|nr:hypothetical protein [Crocinitomicaceae bacterium]
MDINTIKKIFGSMPINDLTAAQAIVKTKSNRNLVVFGILVAAAIGVYAGYRISENKKLREKEQF